VARRLSLRCLDLPYARLQATAKNIGINPRRCFHACVNAIFINFILETRSGNEFSDRLFVIYSSDSDRSPSICFIKPASDWAFGRLLEKYEEQDANAVR
jgi:hypothetical protein